MRRLWGLFLLPGIVAAQSGHGNLESDHPLSFDDAYSLGLGEREVSLSTIAERRFGLHFGAAYGFALNQDVSVGYNSLQEVLEWSYFRGVRREIGDRPAWGYRVTGRFDRNDRASLGLRGVLTQTVGGYERLHVNVDADISREFETGLIVGLSSPIGLPRHFDTVGLAEIGIRIRGSHRATGLIGLGVRHQVNPTSVFSVGLEYLGHTRQFQMGLSVTF